MSLKAHEVTPHHRRSMRVAVATLSLLAFGANAAPEEDAITSLPGFGTPPTPQWRYAKTDGGGTGTGPLNGAYHSPPHPPPPHTATTATTI